MLDYHYQYFYYKILIWGTVFEFTVGIDVDEDKIKLLLEAVEGKDITELIASGREKLASVPSGGGVAVSAAATAGAAGATAPAEAETKKEEKEELKEESDDVSIHIIYIYMLPTICCCNLLT